MKIHHLLITVTLILSACGFHLRGSQTAASADFSNIYIRSVGANKLTAEVKSQLQIAGVNTSQSSEGAEYILTLAKESIQRSVLSVSAETGKVEEYQLELRAKMSVSKAGGETLLLNEPLHEPRDFVFDAEAVLGKFTEEKVIREELIRQAALQVIRTINSVIK